MNVARHPGAVSVLGPHRCGGPTRDRFFVAGRIEPADEAAFDGLTVEYDHDTTTLSGVVADPRALMTILVRIIELDLILLGLRANGHLDEPAG